LDSDKSISLDGVDIAIVIQLQNHRIRLGLANLLLNHNQEVNQAKAILKLWLNP
jgi:hypothetical protein